MAEVVISEVYGRNRLAPYRQKNAVQLEHSLYVSEVRQQHFGVGRDGFAGTTPGAQVPFAI